jgi:hypothetical protein
LAEITAAPVAFEPLLRFHRQPEPLPPVRNLAQDFVQKVADDFFAWRDALPPGMKGQLILRRDGEEPMVVRAFGAREADCVRIWGTVAGQDVEAFAHYSRFVFEHVSIDIAEGDDEGGENITLH